MSDEAHAGRTPAQDEAAAAHGSAPTCAWPDGCEHPVPRARTGRPARYCGQLVDGITHNATNAGNRRRRGPAGGNAPQPSAPAETAAVLAARATATEQAHTLAGALDDLRDHLESYVATLAQLTDADAHARDVEAERRRADRAIQAAADERDEAREDAEQARADLTEERAAREDADAATDAARQAEATARQELERARAEAEDARTAAERARTEADDRVATVETDAARRIREAEQAAEQRVTEAQQQAEETVREARAELARELETVREDEQRRAREAEERARAAEDRAQEAEQRAARAEQARTDAEQQAEWLRTQNTELRQQYRDDLADARAQADARIRDVVAAYGAGRGNTTHDEHDAETQPPDKD